MQSNQNKEPNKSFLRTSNKMRFFLLLVSALAIATSAQDWAPATSSDKRSPCPAVNALANHGYINRNGVGINQADFVNAITSVLNVDSGLANTLVGTAIKFLGYTDSTGTKVIDLDALRKHNVIEHDASLTRKDIGDSGADNYSPQPDLIEQLKGLSTDGQTLGWTEIAKARNLRTSQESASDPSYGLDVGHAVAAYTEAAFTLRVLGTGESIPLDFIDSWFGQEKIPDDWSAPSSAYTAAQAALDAAKIKALALVNLS
eukprot:TRINITY_DN1947_c0_g4_i2.p2 TRINITY_DN1947_c0_g4~~TRINITY_DN1947_c0_g4_i2.p2  ORF type:complete len:259 (-),score=91.36 TRINITY_DN1947_c0_g4_i2:1735-2511(-)